MRLATTREGGFRIEPGGGAAALAVSAAGDGWEVSQGPSGARWLLERDRSYPGGFVLSDRRGGASSRTTREADGDGAPSNLLAPDGRLFLIRRRGADAARFELSGWEVPGAYLVARPEGDGFDISLTDAGLKLDVAVEVLILFAAEILDAIAADARG